MDDHQQKPTSPFSPGAGRIPIVGQAFEIGQFQVTALLVCKCDGPHPLLVTMTGITPCPECGKGYTIQGVTVKVGQPPHFSIGLAPKQQPGEPRV